MTFAIVQHFIGETSTLEFKFVNSSGVAANPSSISLKIGVWNKATGVVDQLTNPPIAQGAMSNPVVGTWRYDYTWAQEGLHIIEVDSSGTPTTVIYNESVMVVPDLTWSTS